MAERTARLGLMHYQDSDGQFRTATAGDTIQVHPDYVDTFDSLNVLAGHKPEARVADKPKPRQPRKAVE